jgi:hypothetical protein
MEPFAPKHPASFTTGMNRMDGDEKDKSRALLGFA